MGLGTNASFPVPSGHRVYLHCGEGYQVAGDKSLVCFQVHLYRFSAQPSCERKYKLFIFVVLSL